MNTSYEWLAQHTTKESLSLERLATGLSAYRIIEVSGPDSVKFLQGQLTCDIKQLALKGHLQGSHCNIKGHMVSVFRLFYRNEEQIWLRVHNEIAQLAFDTLKKYSIFSKVKLSFLDDISGVALGSDTVKALGEALNFKAFESSDISQSDTGVLARYDDQLFELWTEDSNLASTLESSLSSGPIEATSDDLWLLANIERAIPDIRATTAEHFIPQMTNMQAIAGVSFNKGCYTGQEIVTRLQHRGILKKAMYRFATSASAPNPGDALIDAEGKTVGEVVISANSTSGSKFLAVVQQSQVVAGTELTLPNGEAVTNEGLPYELDPRMFESKR